jgi:hypothetical protein
MRISAEGSGLPGSNVLDASFKARRWAVASALLL